MLNIYTANQIESLISQLCYNLQEQPLRSPFDQEIIAVSNSAMERWLQVNISQILGVEANYNFPLPAALLWSILRQSFPYLPDQDPLSRANLQWHIFTHLPKLLELAEFELLAHYTQSDAQGIKRWQLAAQIADIFDRYQYYRNDWLELVDADNQWQALLWQSIVEHIKQHKTEIVARYLQHLHAGTIEAEALPERISLFAPSTLPPLILDTLLQLADFVQIDFYLLAPTNQYWLDLVSQKVAAKRRLSDPDVAKYMETGNRLLSSWGKQGQVFFDQLVSISEYAQEYQQFQEPENYTVLQQIKHDIYHLYDADVYAEKSAKNDRSISIHICHSPLREIQVLHDNLLNVLAHDPSLSPEDILVVAPNISEYAAYIEAVFRQSDNSPFIPWNISDLSANEDIPLIRIFLQLFKLAESRFTHSEVLAYLDVTEVRNKFSLQDDEVVLIKQWLEAGAIRWGKSAQHKANLNLPAISQNTWEQTQQRLFMGYAMGEMDTLYEDIAPLPHIEGNNSEILGKFWQLYRQLERYSQQLKKQQSLADWQITINRLLDSFFDDQFLEESHLQTIRDAVDQLMLNAQGIDPNTLISRQLLCVILENNLAEVGNLHSFMSGGVSFSGFKPMRNLPFKVIAVLGLNDGSFPRQVHKTNFDLMQKNYRLGDPNPRDEDRYLFLETLLSAQDQLLMSYIGRDIKDNTEKQASVLLKELLDYIDLRFCQSDTPAQGSYSHSITTVHRLQAYHDSYFKTDSENMQHSYAHYWCNIAQKINDSSIKKDPISWQNRPELETPDAAWFDIDVSRLVRFFQHPMRFFLQQRLGIYLHNETKQINDDEPFALNALEQYQLKNNLLEEWLQKRNQNTDQAMLHAKGILPHGNLANEIIDTLMQTLQPIIQQTEQLLGDESVESLAINLSLNNKEHIQGSVQNIYPTIGLVEIKASPLKGRDQINFWINYMCYRLSAPDHYCHDAYFIDSKKFYHIGADCISLQEARDYLECLLGYYRLGICKPLALLPQSSYAFMQAQSKGKNIIIEDSPAWRSDGQFNRPLGDQYDPYIQMVLRGLNDLPIHSQEFMDLAQDIYQYDLNRHLS
jgi:exodeoxyribonuclease V gamma subunit